MNDAYAKLLRLTKSVWVGWSNCFKEGRDISTPHQQHQQQFFLPPLDSTLLLFSLVTLLLTLLVLLDADFRLISWVVSKAKASSTFSAVFADASINEIPNDLASSYNEERERVNKRNSAHIQKNRQKVCTYLFLHLQ